MILLAGILFGALTGIILAKLNNHSYQPIQLNSWWLVFIAFIPQLVAFHIPSTSRIFPDNLASAALVGSQSLLLVFAYLNFKKPGMMILTAGLFLNLLVILLNQGLMPISPETIEYLLPENSNYQYEIGSRLEGQKDIILPIVETNLWVLSDRLVLPKWLNYPVAFSIGDIIIAAGAFVAFLNPGLFTSMTPDLQKKEIVQ